MKYLIPFLIGICLLQSCHSPTERLEGYEVHGIDVSRYQQLINWDTVATQPIDFVFLKATEGETLVDTHFKYNWATTKKKGLKRGAYHFFHPTLAATTQATNFINTVSLEYGDLPPVVDFEVINGVSKKQVIHRLRSWLNIIEKHYQIRPIIYTNQKLYKRYIADHFADHIIWMARYNQDMPVMKHPQDWHFWQYGNRGVVKGIEGPVDLNVFNGSYLELEKLCYSPRAAFSGKE